MCAKANKCFVELNISIEIKFHILFRFIKVKSIHKKYIMKTIAFFLTFSFVLAIISGQEAGGPSSSENEVDFYLSMIDVKRRRIHLFDELY